MHRGQLRFSCCASQSEGRANRHFFWQLHLRRHLVALSRLKMAFVDVNVSDSKGCGCVVGKLPSAHVLNCVWRQQWVTRCKLHINNLVSVGCDLQNDHTLHPHRFSLRRYFGQSKEVTVGEIIAFCWATRGERADPQANRIKAKVRIN